MDFDLERFVTAQDAGDSYANAIAELEAGRKVGHFFDLVRADSVFDRALDAFYAGERDQTTLDMVADERRELEEDVWER